MIAERFFYLKFLSKDVQVFLLFFLCLGQGGEEMTSY